MSKPCHWTYCSDGAVCNYHQSPSHICCFATNWEQCKYNTPPPLTKPNYLLMPLQVLEGVAKTFMAGAGKHDKAGVGWKSLPKDQKTKDKYDEKALRHLFQANSGEGVDEESGVDHRYHAIADLMIRMWLEE